MVIEKDASTKESISSGVSADLTSLINPFAKARNLAVSKNTLERSGSSSTAVLAIITLICGLNWSILVFGIFVTYILMNIVTAIFFRK